MFLSFSFFYFLVSHSLHLELLLLVVPFVLNINNNTPLSCFLNFQAEKVVASSLAALTRSRSNSMQMDSDPEFQQASTCFPALHWVLIDYNS